MAQQNIGSLIINLEARTAQIQQDMAQTKRIVGDAMGSIQQDSKRAAEAMEQTADAAGSLQQAGAAVAAGWALDSLKDQVIDVARALHQAQIASEKLQKTLFYANGGDIKAIAADIEWLRKLSNELGQEFDSTSVAYAQFAGAVRGSGLEAYGRQIFESMAIAASAFGMSSDEAQGAMLALVQMSAKGVVQAEEFRGQLSERMPVAAQAAAQALGVTTAEFNRMLESGEIVADEFLPKFSAELRKMSQDAAAFGGEAQKASAQFNNAWDGMKKEVAASGLGAFISGQLSIMADAFNDFSSSVRAARAEGAGFWGQAAAGGGAVLRFLNPVNAVKYTPQSDAVRADYLKKEIANKQRTLFDWSITETLPQKQASISAMSRELADIERRTAKVGQDINAGQKQAAAAAAAQKAAEGRAADYVGNGKNQTKKERQAKELADEDAAFKAATAGLKKNSKAYLDALSAHESRKAELIESHKTKARTRSGGRAAQYGSTEDRELANLKALIENEKLAAAALAEYGAEAEKLTPGQKLLNKLTQEQAVAKTAAAKAHIEAKIVLAQDLVVREQANAAAKDGLKLDREREEAAFAASVAVEDQILQLQQQAAEYGLTAAQIADNTARTWELSLAESEKNGASAESIDYLRQQADAYRRVADAQFALQDRADSDKADKTAAEQAKAVADEWQKAADQINQSLTDALMRGFESGRGFGESFAESLEATFKAMILKPAVEFAVNSAMGGMGQLASAAGVPGVGQSSALSAAYGNAAPSLFGLNSASIDAWGAKHLGTANVGQNFVGPLPAGQTAGMTLSAGLGAAGAGMTVGGSIGGMVGQKTGSQEIGALTGAASGAAMGFMIGGGPMGAVIGGVAGGLMGYLGSGGGGEKKAKRNTAIGKVGADGTINAYDGGNGSDGSNVGAARKMAESFAAVQEQMRVVGDFNKSLGASFGIGSVRKDYFTVGKESFTLSAGDKDGILLKAVQSAARQSTATDSYVRKAVLNIKSSQDLGKLGEIIEFAKNYRYQLASMEAARDPRAAQRADLRAEAFASADQRRQALAAQMQQAKESGFDVKRLLAAQRNQVLADLGLVNGNKPLEGVALEMATVTANAEAMRSVLSELGYSVAAQDKLIAQSVAAQRAQKRTDWMLDIRTQLLQITDASKLAEEQLKKDAAARLADAKALGVNAAQLQQVAQLNALEAARVAAEAYRSRTAFGQNLKVRELNLAGKTKQASLSEFDYAARLEVLDAKAAGKSAADIARLEKVLAQERLKVIKDFNQQALDAQKQLATSLKDWLSGQKLGDLSSLSPDAKLAEARKQYDALYSLARSGDAGAQDKLTAAAESLLAAGKAMYASGTDYTSLESYVTGGIGKLGKALKLPGFARGGLAQGWAIVGEEGPELVNFSNPGRVYTADQTSAALDWSRYGRQDNAALVTEVRALRQEVSQLRAERRQADAEHQQQRGAIAQAELGEAKATRRTLERGEATKL